MNDLVRVIDVRSVDVEYDSRPELDAREAFRRIWDRAWEAGIQAPSNRR